MYYTTSDLFKKGYLPPSLKGYIKEVCEHCGLPIIMNTELTQRMCANPSCIEHMSHRADRMLKYLGVKQVGPATCKSILLMNDSLSHLEILPVIFRENKPKVYLYEVARLNFIPGVQETAEDMLAGYPNFETYFNDEDKIKPKIMLDYSQRLIDSQKYFDIKPSLSNTIIEVMITGRLSGYTKDEFVGIANNLAGHLFKTKQVGLKNSARYLVTENPNSSSQKAKLARGELRSNVRIPIVSPKDYLNMCAYLAKEVEEREADKQQPVIVEEVPVDETVMDDL